MLGEKEERLRRRTRRILAHPTKIRTAARACASVPCGSLLDELVMVEFSFVTL